MPARPVGDEAAALVDSADLVLVDFDGPLTRLLPGQSWREVSARVRSRAGELGGPALQAALEGQPDHVQCLRLVAERDPSVVPALARLVTRMELAAARRATPTRHAARFLERCLDRGMDVVVVTNNDPRVVPLVLDRARPGLVTRLTAVLGRDDGRLDTLKPSPAMLHRALATTGRDATAAVLLGDSVTDVEAGLAAGAAVVGVADDAERRADLLRAGATAVVPDLGRLLPGSAGAGPT